MASPKAKPRSPRRKQNRADTTLDVLDLTPRRAAFCREYMIDLCAARAARRAGFSNEQAKTASVKLLRDPWVRAEIQAEMAERAERTRIKADDILRELGAIARLNPLTVLTWAGTDVHLKPSTEISPEDAAAIASIKTVFSVTGEKSIEIKFQDKMRAAQLVMQHLGMIGRVTVPPDDLVAEDAARLIADDSDPEQRN
ncbi:MAG: hypothetical protein DI601_00235 [Azospirillum brasilense]|nr:MAG: hypothetical protein DI601_00235 [Azospirillum brasilense]